MPPLDPTKSLSHVVERFEEADVIAGFETEELIKIQIFKGTRLVTLELSLPVFGKLYSLSEAIANAVPVSGMTFSIQEPTEKV